MGRSFLRRWKRNLLTIIALSISFSMVLALSSLSRGMEMAAEGASGETPRDLAITSAGLTPSIEDAHASAEALNEDVRNVTSAMPVLTAVGRLGFPKVNEKGTFRGTLPSPEREFEGDFESESVGLVGIVPGMARRFVRDDTLVIRSELLRLNGYFSEEGSPFRDSGYRHGWTGELLIDENLAVAHALELGDPVLFIAPDGKVVDAFRLTGLIRTSLLGGGLSSKLLGGIAMMHLGEVQYLEGYGSPPQDGIGGGDLCNAIYIDLSRNSSTGLARNDFIVHLSSLFPGHSVVGSEGRLYRLEEEVLVLNIFSLGVGGTALFIGGLFLSSVMVMDVEDRMKDISIMRAIGISRVRIYLQVLKDSMVLSFLGIALGSFPGILVSSAMNGYLRDLYGLDIDFFLMGPDLIAMSALFLLLTVMVFSIIPGSKAMMMRPRDALNATINR